MPFGRLFEARHGPFGELQREINSLFDSVVSHGRSLGRGLLQRACPPVNISEGEDQVLVECELPGADPNSLDVSLTHDVLTIKGERPAVEPDEDTRVHIHERGYGAFNRAITVPSSVQGEDIDARYENGVLIIRLPKAQEDKPKTVTVQVSE